MPTVLPTPAELEILTVLWQRGPRTVRQVHEALDPQSRRAYTTILKLMQIMYGKGLLLRDGRRHRHLYRPAAPPELTQRALIRDLARRAFAGSTAALIGQALTDPMLPTRARTELWAQLADPTARPGTGSR